MISILYFQNSKLSLVNPPSLKIYFRNDFSGLGPIA